MVETIHTIVFQARGGGGNPCPVTINADGLTAEQMQSMTHDFGAESAFLIKPTRTDCDIKVRYFLPLHETDMCMHATVGSVTVLIRRGLCQTSPIMLETNLGPMRVEWEMRGEQIDVAVEQFLPKYQQTAPTVEELCQALRIAPNALAGGPIQSVSTSRFKLLIPLISKSILNDLEPDFELLWSLCDRCETTGSRLSSTDLLISGISSLNLEVDTDWMGPLASFSGRIRKDLHISSALGVIC